MYFKINKNALINMEIDEPSYWVLNPLNNVFNIIPKKRKALVKDISNNYVENETFVLCELAWVPRRGSFLPKLIEKLKRRLSFTNTP
jgi:hypothetical protein